MTVAEFKAWLEAHARDDDEIKIWNPQHGRIDPHPVVKAEHPGANGTGHIIVIEGWDNSPG